MRGGLASNHQYKSEDSDAQRALQGVVIHESTEERHETMSRYPIGRLIGNLRKGSLCRASRIAGHT